MAARAAHGAFAHRAHGGKRLYWKMSVDLSRHLVATEGQHDPLDGFATTAAILCCTELAREFVSSTPTGLRTSQEDIMLGRATPLFTSAILTALILMAAPAASAQEPGYPAMEDVGAVRVAFDFRIGDPDVALSHFDLIHSMLRDSSMIRDGTRPEIVVVFIGPSVKLISTEGDQFPKINQKISDMNADGVKFEICLTTAHALDIPPESILPGIVQVGNGWISLIGYQHQGYAMIANF
jgi:uncharacterized protein